MNTTSGGQGIYRAFLACLVIVSLPIKNFAYVAPACYLLVLLLNREYRVAGRMLLLSSLVLLVSAVAIVWDHLAGRTVNFPGLWLGLITYAPLLIVLCETFDRKINDATYQKLVTACVWFIVLQSFVGVFQFMATGNPDAVCGTFGLLDGFKQQITITQVYFTFTVFGMILFLIPAANRWPPRIAIAMGVLICMLAQSGHQIIFFVVSLVLCGMLRLSSIGTLARTFAAATVMMALMLQFYPNTIWLAQEWYRKAAETPDSPKRLALEGAAAILAEPKNLLMGTGLGQYSSRAALITSDEYLSVKLPRVLTGRSTYFDEHIRQSLFLFDKIGEGSAIAKPYMSAVSIPVEWGLVPCFIFLFIICRQLIWSAKVMWAHADQLGWFGFATMVGILFFLMCCLVENYAEFSQAIFAPFVLFVAARSRAETMLRARAAEQPAGRALMDGSNAGEGLALRLRPSLPR
jgi:hypothetical protein